MPSKKKKYNARFPAGRIKKIMQTDEEVGKVAQAVPVIISRTLELFVESLLTKSMQITQARSAKTLTPSHMKQCILSESRFDFLKDLVKNIPDPSAQEDIENNANEALDYSVTKTVDEPPKAQQENNKSKPEIVANFYTEQGTSAGRTPVIQYGPKVAQVEQPKLNFSVQNIVNKEPAEPKLHIDLTRIPVTATSSSNQVPVPQLIPSTNNKSPVIQNVPASTSQVQPSPPHDNVPPLIPISHNNLYGNSSGDNNLYIDEDYDN